MCKRRLWEEMNESLPVTDNRERTQHFSLGREERLHTFTTFNLKSSCCWVQPCSHWKPIPVRLSLQVQENNSHKQTGIQQLTSITMTNLTLNISCSDPIHFQMNSTHFHFTLHFYCALHTPKDTYILLMYPISVLPKPVLEAPLPCTFCMSPLSNTPDSTHQLVSRDWKNYIGCVWLGRHTKCAGQGVLQDRFGKHCPIYFKCTWISINNNNNNNNNVK